jgi:putative transcriptional regulator
MSQSAFAKAFHLNLRTLQKWEIGEARPDGPARVLLWLIINAPQVILKLLKGSG